MTGQQLYESTEIATAWPWARLERRTQTVFELAAAIGAAPVLAAPEDVEVNGVSGTLVLRELAAECEGVDATG